MTTASARRTRGKTERFLRYVIRRKPCGYILLGNILALALFISGIIGLYIAAKYYAGQNRLYEDEEKILEKFYANSITFGHCRYKSSTPEWNKELCERNCGPNAFAYRNYELDTFQEYDKSCIDKMDVMLCHENFTRPCIMPRSGKEAIKSCSGFEGVPMGLLTEKKDPDAKPILVNALSNEDLENNYMNKKLLSSELVVQCPECSVITIPFYVLEAADDGSDSCYRVLETEREGWPHFGRFCDPLEKDPGKRKKSDQINHSRFSTRSLPAENSKVMTLQELKDMGVPKNRAAGSDQGSGGGMSDEGQCVAVSIKDNS